MISPKVLRAAFVAALRGSAPVLAQLAGRASHVIEYAETGDLYSAISKLKPPSLLVYYAGFAPTGRRESYWAHSFGIAIRPAGDPFDLAAAIVDSVMNVEIHPEYHFMEVPSLGRRSIPVGESTSFDYFEFTTRFLSKGVQ